MNDVANPSTSLRAIKACLDYLYMETVQADLELTANLIGAASESLADLLLAQEYVEKEAAEPPRPNGTRMRTGPAIQAGGATDRRVAVRPLTKS